MSKYLRSGLDGPRRLRELLGQGEPVLAPGVYDALGARLVEDAGFTAAYMTGFGTAAALLGRPDVGLLTMSEMVDNARRIVRACDLPVIADADTGYGNAVNVVRTVQEYEQAGVAAIQIEDQLAPKRCGHMDGKELVPADEMVSKVRAATAARSSDDLVLIARTDAAAVEGISAAIDRARRYRDAGADVLFVEAITSEADLEAVASQLAGTPLLFNWVEGGRTPPVAYDRLRELGFSILIFPVTTLLTATAAVRTALAELAAAKAPAPPRGDGVSFDDFVSFIGLPEIDELEQRFTD